MTLVGTSHALLPRSSSHRCSIELAIVVASSEQPIHDGGDVFEAERSHGSLVPAVLERPVHEHDLDSTLHQGAVDSGSGDGVTPDAAEAVRDERRWAVALNGVQHDPAQHRAIKRGKRDAVRGLVDVVESVQAVRLLELVNVSDGPAACARCVHEGGLPGLHVRLLVRDPGGD